MFNAKIRRDLLVRVAPDYLATIDANIQKVYPNFPWLVVSGPRVLPHHHEAHPVFYGCFDWHSCVEMWWAAIRIMRLLPDVDGQEAVRATMSRLLKPEGVAIESEFFEEPGHGGFERPYGWGWLLTLQHELNVWDDAQGHEWASILSPLSTSIADRFAIWLPKLAYPQRHGMHPNTAFALIRSLPYAIAQAERGNDRLQTAIVDWTTTHFANDRDYPAHFEPGGADFLSGALTEAELMSLVLSPGDFPDWLSGFLPGLSEGKPDALFTPGRVTDHRDGQAAHLSGLNLSRSAGFLAIAGALRAGDARISVLEAAAERHAEASLDAATGSDYMEEHWIAAYATMLLSI